MDDTITRTNPSVSRLASSFSKLELALEVVRAAIAVYQTTRRIVANWERKGLRFRRGSPLACGVMDIACSSVSHFADIIIGNY